MVYSCYSLRWLFFPVNIHAKCCNIFSIMYVEIVKENDHLQYYYFVYHG